VGKIYRFIAAPDREILTTSLYGLLSIFEMPLGGFGFRKRLDKRSKQGGDEVISRLPV
jgi:hypothetical protein